jgi:hypothetical protein
VNDAWLNNLCFSEIHNKHKNSVQNVEILMTNLAAHKQPLGFKKG